MRDGECVAFLQWALPRMGLRWKGFRKVRRQVCRRIRARISELSVEGLPGYRQRLAEDPAEWAVLDTLCNVTISRFFRDRSVWRRIVDEVLPRLAARGSSPSRAWSAGCASGEEPYSLSIAWRLGGPRRPESPPEVLATDRDPILLERARRGVYPEGALKELPESWRAVAFQPVASRGGKRLFRLRDSFREGVTFLRSELRTQMPEGPFSLILCRNLAFTYFDVPTQRKVLGSLLERTVPGGYLVLGSHESLPDGSWRLEPLPGERRILRVSEGPGIPHHGGV